MLIFVIPTQRHFAYCRCSLPQTIGKPMENVIVITGGSRGIGAATALLAAHQGYRICINYHADDQAAEAILSQVRALGAEAIAVRADVSVEDEIIQLFLRVDDELGPVTALVNNAGTIGQQSRVEDMSEFRLLNVMKTNVVGPMLCAKHALLRMARRHGGQGGAIVNVSSVAARLGSPNEYVDYAASKGALDTFTIGLAKEVAGEGVRVNGVRPGYIHTGFHALSGDPDRVSKLEPGLPMGRGGASRGSGRGHPLVAFGQSLLCHRQLHRPGRRALNAPVKFPVAREPAPPVRPVRTAWSTPAYLAAVGRR